MVIMRAPNSTPIVKSCTGWKRLSVNCSRRHDLPTPTQYMLYFFYQFVVVWADKDYGLRGWQAKVEYCRRGGIKRDKRIWFSLHIQYTYVQVMILIDFFYIYKFSDTRLTTSQWIKLCPCLYYCSISCVNRYIQSSDDEQSFQMELWGAPNYSSIEICFSQHTYTNSHFIVYNYWNQSLTCVNGAEYICLTPIFDMLGICQNQNQFCPFLKSLFYIIIHVCYSISKKAYKDHLFPDKINWATHIYFYI